MTQVHPSSSWGTSADSAGTTLPHLLFRRRPGYLSPRQSAVKIWQDVVVCSCFLTCLLETFMVSFNSTFMSLWVLAYLGDLIFLMDVIVSFFLAYFDNKGILVTDRKKIMQRYLKSTFVLDTLSIFPTDILAFMLPTTSRWKLLTMARMNRLIRFYKVIQFFGKRDQSLGSKIFLMQSLKYAVICILATHWATCAWFALSCVGFHQDLQNTCYNNTWGQMFDFGFDLGEVDTFHAYIISLYWAVATETSTGYGDVSAVTGLEYWFAVFVMLAGIAVYFGMLLGGMTSILTNVDAKRARYVHRLNTIKEHMIDTGVAEDLQRQVINYYEYVWLRNKGVHTEGIYNALPLAFQAEISHTTCQSILEKAPLFNDLGAGFLRMMSLNIKPMFFLPKQLIITRGDLGHHMYFIHQGEVEVLSEADDETPVATLKSGKLFGEASLVFSMPRTASIRAATHCDLMVLHKQDLNNILTHFPEIGHKLQADARKRCKIAEELVTEEAEEINPHYEAFRPRGSVIVVPNQKKRQAFSSFSDSSSVTFHTKKPRTSVVLSASLEVLQSDMETDSSLRELITNNTSTTTSKMFGYVTDVANWLKNTTIHPHSLLAQFWERLILAIILIIAVWYPYVACFTAYEERSDYNYSNTGRVLLVVSYVLDFFLVLDIAMALRTDILTPYGTLSNFSDLYKNYCFTCSFACDVVAVLPLEIFSFVKSVNVQRWQLFALLRLNRLAKFIRVPQFFSRMESYLDMSVSLLRSLKMLMYIILLSHWTACILYAVACFGPQCAADSWIVFWAREKGDPGYNNTAPGTEYITSLYWAVATMTSTGYGDISAHTTLGRLFSLTAMLIGLLLYGYCLSSMAATLVNQGYARVRFQERLFAVKNFMKERQLGLPLQERVVHYLTLLWEKYRGEWLPGHEPMMHDMPVALQEDIAVEDAFKTLSKVPLFQATDNSFLRKLALKTQSYIFCPGDIIIYANDMGREMYCIRRGVCQVVSPNRRKILAEIGPGQYFGEIGMVFADYRSATILAKTHVEALMLKKSDLDVVLKDFPLLQEQFCMIRNDENRLKKIRNLTAKRMASSLLPQFRASGAKALSVDQKYETKWQKENNIQRMTLQDSLQRFGTNMEAETRKEYQSSFGKLNQISKIFAHLLLRMTFKPTGFLLKIWTSLMVAFAVVSCFTVPLQAAFMHTNVALWIVNYTLDIFSYVNLYIGFHIAFYNEENVLVTHPLSTAKNYLRTNFLVDLLTCFPLELFAYCALPHYSTDSVLHMLALIRLNRLLQVYRLPLAFSYLEFSVKRKTGSIREVKFFFYMMIFMHWWTCTLFVMACPPSLSGSTANFVTTQNAHQCLAESWICKVEGYNISDVGLGTMYTISLYWASATSVSVGYGDISAATDTEMVVAVICMIMGVVFFGYIIASVAASLANADRQRARFQKRLSSIKDFIEDQKLSESLKKRVLAHYDYVWQRTKGVDPNSLFDGLPYSLWSDVTLSLYEEVIAKILACLESS